MESKCQVLKLILEGARNVVALLHLRRVRLGDISPNFHLNRIYYSYHVASYCVAIALVIVGVTKSLSFLIWWMTGTFRSSLN
jgi:hypothetical protein